MLMFALPTKEKNNSKNNQKLKIFHSQTINNVHKTMHPFDCQQSCLLRLKTHAKAGFSRQ